MLGQHGANRSIVSIDYCDLCGHKDTRLSCGISRHGAVAVQMVRRHIEHRGGSTTQRGAGLQLIARQLDDIELPTGTQQIQCWFSEIAAYASINTGLTCHLAYESSYRAFTVGAGNSNHRNTGRIGLQRE